MPARLHIAARLIVVLQLALLATACDDQDSSHEVCDSGGAGPDDQPPTLVYVQTPLPDGQVQIVAQTVRW